MNKKEFKSKLLRVDRQNTSRDASGLYPLEYAGKFVAEQDGYLCYFSSDRKDMIFILNGYYYIGNNRYDFGKDILEILASDDPEPTVTNISPDSKVDSAVLKELSEQFNVEEIIEMKKKGLI